MSRVIQKGLGDVGRLADCRKINGLALPLEVPNRLSCADPGSLTLLCGQPDNCLRIWLSIHFVPPRFLGRLSTGSCTSASTCSIPLIWSAKSLAYISHP